MSVHTTAVRIVTGIAGAEHRLLEQEVGGDFEILAARGACRAAVATAESALTSEERIEEVAETTAGTAAEEVAAAGRTRRPDRPRRSRS